MNRENHLATRKVLSLVLSLALPAICAQLVSLCYNAVDRIFVGRMADGTLAMAGIGVCAPVTMIFGALTGLFGSGGAPLAAIRIGKGEVGEAERYLGVSVVMLVGSSLLVTAAALLLMDPVLTAFGASSDTLPYARDYFRIYSIGTVFLIFTVGMNSYISSQGFAGTAMVTTMLGCVLNILLDPLFLYVLDLGVAGAALATVVSQAVSCVWVLVFLFGEKTYLRIRPANLRIRGSILREICGLGLSPAFMSISEGVLHMCFNRQALILGGDVAVSTMTILFTTFNFVQLPLNGFSSGAQPVVSYCCGSGQIDRMKQALRIADIICTVSAAVGCGLLLLFPRMFVSVFTKDPELLEVGSKMLRIYAAGLFALGPNTLRQQSYVAMGEGARGLFFALVRKGFLLIPLIYLLPALFGRDVYHLALAEPISDISVAVVNICYYRHFMPKKWKRMEDERKHE